ncbi:NACHT, LRR and PYD domains-containing protein 12-like [Diadema antillarum]|uniref:NACHT, LRR and PYD domains-containing protein 12-like n=1 Tax=Diadema antillarum TaxID=105358 RepID=UPI003A85E06F
MRFTETDAMGLTKTARGTHDMLTKWRQGVPTEMQRPLLKHALQQAGLVLLAEQFFPNVQLTSSEGVGEKAENSDIFLSEIAKDIEGEQQVRALGSTLGFTSSDVQKFLSSSRAFGRVTCRGATDMLFKWRQRILPENQRVCLKRALVRAGLVFLADKHLADVAIVEGFQVDTLAEGIDAIARLGKALREHYRTFTCQIQRKPWDPTDFADLKNLFTNIIIYIEDRVTGEIERRILPNSVADVFREKVHDTLPRRILMLAHAGRGKTCFVAKLAYDWLNQDEGSPLSEVPLFFAFQMRALEKDMSLGEAALSGPLGLVHGVTAASLEDFIGRHEEDCVFAFDGYDEYKARVTVGKSQSDILLILADKKYRRCRTVVTTRPFLEQDFRQPLLVKAYTKMEIQGFTQTLSYSFIDKYFHAKGKKPEGDQLKQFIRHEDWIVEMIKIPLLCTMVCCLWEEQFIEDVSTMTGLFDSIMQFLLAHAQAKDENLNCDYQSLLDSLGEVALAGLVSSNQTLVFEESAFDGVRGAVDEGVALGILSKQTLPVRRLAKDGITSKTYIEFFHKLGQEYLAARFLSSDSERLKRFLERLSSSETPLMYANMTRFVAGQGFQPRLSVLTTTAAATSADKRQKMQNLMLECFCESNTLDEDVANLDEELFTFLSDGKLVLWSTTSIAVLGVQKLPSCLQVKVTSVELMYCYLEHGLTDQLWRSLASCKNLREMKIWESSLNFCDTPKLITVTRLTVGPLEHTYQYVGLIASLPSLQELSVENNPNLDKLNAVITSVATGLRHTDSKLRCLTISGCNGRLSEEAVELFLDCSRMNMPCLEKLELISLRIEEVLLVHILMRFRASRYMSNIRIINCTQEGGAVQQYLNFQADNIHGGIEVALQHTFRNPSRTYKIPSTYC